MTTIGGCGLEALLEGTRMCTNITAGIQEQLNAREVAEGVKEKILPLQQILKETIEHLTQNRQCIRVYTHGNARFEVK